MVADRKDDKSKVRPTPTLLLSVANNTLRWFLEKAAKPSKLERGAKELGPSINYVLQNTFSVLTFEKVGTTSTSELPACLIFVHP